MVAEPRTLHEFQPPVGLGALAKALAKAQSEFPTIERTREVKVTTKTGGSYTFKYAPLDVILAAVRTPLSSNGLAISQLLEGGDLRTVLLHESGATLEAAVPLPHNAGDTVQQLGSAITYLRRYALQAILGIASEEDDDGNAASGNKATATDRRAAATERLETASADGLIGVASTGKGDADFELRQSPKGYVLIFRLVDGRKGIKVVAEGALAEAIAANRPRIEDQRITAWGRVSTQEFTPKDTGRKVEYQVLHLSRLTAADLTLPAEDGTAPEPPAAVVGAGAEAACGAVDASVMDLGTCQLIAGHKSAHKSADGSWPR